MTSSNSSKVKDLLEVPTPMLISNMECRANRLTSRMIVLAHNIKHSLSMIRRNSSTFICKTRTSAKNQWKCSRRNRLQERDQDKCFKTQHKMSSKTKKRTSMPETFQERNSRWWPLSYPTTLNAHKSTTKTRWWCSTTKLNLSSWHLFNSHRWSDHFHWLREHPCRNKTPWRANSKQLLPKLKLQLIITRGSKASRWVLDLWLITPRATACSSNSNNPMLTCTHKPWTGLAILILCRVDQVTHSISITTSRWRLKHKVIICNSSLHSLTIISNQTYNIRAANKTSQRQISTINKKRERLWWHSLMIFPSINCIRPMATRSET